MNEPESVIRLQELLEKVEAARAQLERSEDPEQAVQVLQELAELAKEVQVESSARAGSDEHPDELRRLTDDSSEACPRVELEARAALRYSLLAAASGSARCSAWLPARRSGGTRESCRGVRARARAHVQPRPRRLARSGRRRLRAAAERPRAVRRDVPSWPATRCSRRPSASHCATGARVARELADATLGMIGGQYLDVTTTSSAPTTCGGSTRSRPAASCARR